jgi:hypothetical protein
MDRKLIGGLASIILASNVSAGLVPFKEKFDKPILNSQLTQAYDFRGTSAPESGHNLANGTYDFVRTTAGEGGIALMINELVPVGWRISYTLNRDQIDGNNIAGFFIGAGMDDPIYASSTGARDGIGRWDAIDANWENGAGLYNVLLNTKSDRIDVQVEGPEGFLFTGSVVNPIGRDKISIGGYTGPNGTQKIFLDNLRVSNSIPSPNAGVLGALGLGAGGVFAGRRRR